MYGIELKQRLLKDWRVRRYFRGVFPCDRLPTNVDPGIPHTFIINLDTHDQPGTHWVALYITSYGHAVYFDSFGVPPFIYSIQAFISRNSRTMVSNAVVIQSLTTQTCGFYCIFFITQMCRGANLYEIQQHFDSRFPQRNDKIILHLVGSPRGVIS